MVILISRRILVIGIVAVSYTHLLLVEGKLQHKGEDAPPQETHRLVQQGGLGQGFHTH